MIKFEKIKQLKVRNILLKYNIYIKKKDKLRKKSNCSRQKTLSRERKCYDNTKGKYRRSRKGYLG